jgi:hypothetical protein
MPGELCSSRNHNDDKLAARKGGVKSEGEATIAAAMFSDEASWNK